MRIYNPLPEDDCELCHPRHKADFERIIQLINGESRTSTWTLLEMETIREDQGRILRESDSPWLGAHALIFTSRAVRTLRGLLEEFGELLPLVCPNADVLMYNPRSLEDALDENSSTIKRFSSSGRIMHISKPVFRHDVISGIAAFKIPQLRNSPVFLSDRFIDAWNASGLRGLEFDEVWASETSIQGANTGVKRGRHST